MTEQLLEALPNPIFFKGTDGRYLGVNRAWENLFGVPRTQIVGKTLHELPAASPEPGAPPGAAPRPGGGCPPPDPSARRAARHRTKRYGTAREHSASKPRSGPPM